MAMLTYNFKRVYVWEIPVRIFHWLTVLSITILIITGFIIADPPAISSNAEAINSYCLKDKRAYSLWTNT